MNPITLYVLLDGVGGTIAGLILQDPQLAPWFI